MNKPTNLTSSPRKTILVAGGAGFIGSHLVRLLIHETRHYVVVVDKLTYAGNLESISDLLSNERLTFCQTDICNRAELDRIFSAHQPNVVMHLAAESHVDRSIDAPGDFIQTNIVGTYTLLEAARQHWDSTAELERSGHSSHKSKGPLFIHVSTDEVHGELALDDSPFTETTPYNPRSPYSASKASSDHLARAWHTTYGLPVIVTSSPNNYGPYQFPEKLVPVVILNAIRGERIPVYGTGHNIRDWLYVEDHAKALVRILDDGGPGETYNIGGNNERRNIDLVRMLCRLLDEIHPKDHGSYEEQITSVTDRPGHDTRYAIDANKITEELGWLPTEEFETGLRKTVTWYLENESWWRPMLSDKSDQQRLGVLSL